MIQSEHDIEITQAIKLFRQTFNTEPEVGVFAPGRANLIGEHTDYNEGYVLPFALPYKTVIVARKIEGTKTQLISGEYPKQIVEFTIDSSLAKGEPTWANYIKGTIFQYLKDLPKNAAFQAAFISNVPIGGGLSSSASLE
jgi:galactokinase